MAAMPNRSFRPASKIRLLKGDCRKLLRRLKPASVDLVVTSPPYCVGKEYEHGLKLPQLRRLLSDVCYELAKLIKVGGSVCWQVGYHVHDGVLYPLDFMIAEIMATFSEFRLRNRIVWTFGHGLHCKNRFSGRHEVILWYTHGSDYNFDLDAVRVDQKYPGKQAHKGAKRGQPSGNPLGKNPSDVWDIPNVKANHCEKTEHPCQFPVGLVQRLVRALCPRNGTVLDPFAGSGSTAVAAAAEGRKFIGCEIDPRYFQIAKARAKRAKAGTAPIRDVNKPVYVPKGGKLLEVPLEFLSARGRSLSSTPRN